MAKILVVDDEPSLREVFRQVLELGGHEVVTAATGQAAEAILYDGVEMLLTDGNLPFAPGGTSEPLGYTLCCAARAMGVPAILVSADVHLIGLAQENGFPVLCKPCGAPDILRAVRKLEAEIPTAVPDEDIVTPIQIPGLPEGLEAFSYSPRADEAVPA